jgi:phasin family protein
MAAKTNPFAGADAFKAFGDFKMPGVNMDVLVAYHRKNLDALSKANQVAVKGFQAVAERQSAILKGAVDNAGKVTEALFAAKSAEEKVRSQAEFAKDGVMTAMNDAQQLAGLVASTAQETAEVLNARLVESFEDVRQIFQANGHAH